MNELAAVILTDTLCFRNQDKLGRCEPFDSGEKTKCLSTALRQERGLKRALPDVRAHSCHQGMTQTKPCPTSCEPKFLSLKN